MLLRIYVTMYVFVNIYSIATIGSLIGVWDQILVLFCGQTIITSPVFFFSLTQLQMIASLSVPFSLRAF